MRRILIDDHIVDARACSYGLPWDSDGMCYNFKMPDECILPSDIAQISDTADIEALVIGCDLDSYDFISDMTNLNSLYIYKGNNVTSLDFVRNLTELNQFYISGSHISDISPFLSLLAKKEKLMAIDSHSIRSLYLILRGIYIESDCEIAENDIRKLSHSRAFGYDLIIKSSSDNTTGDTYVISYG